MLFVDCGLKEILSVLKSSNQVEILRRNWISIAKCLRLTLDEQREIKGAIQKWREKANIAYSLQGDELYQMLGIWTRRLTITRKFNDLVQAVKSAGFHESAGNLS